MRILFQGDSITDACRSKADSVSKGCGYATMVSGKLGYAYPNEHEFMNRGISGNRVTDLLARIQCDMINLEPDVMSILIGVNDVWHEIASQNGVNDYLFEQVYDLLITELKKALPNVKIMILEPFVLEGTATTEHWKEFETGVATKAAIAKRVAEKHNLKFIPLQQKFEEALQSAPAEYWLGDGVHPTSAGHELIAREWVKAFND